MCEITGDRRIGGGISVSHPMLSSPETAAALFAVRTFLPGAAFPPTEPAVLFFTLRTFSISEGRTTHTIVMRTIPDSRSDIFSNNAQHVWGMRLIQYFIMSLADECTIVLVVVLFLLLLLINSTTF